MDRTQEAVPNRLLHAREMHIQIRHLARVDQRTQRLVILPRRTEANRVGRRERTIQLFARRGSGKYTNLVRPSRCVFGLRPLRDGPGNGLRRAGRSEGAEPNGLPMLNHRCGVLCC
jgi:hypothetical protein